MLIKLLKRLASGKLFSNRIAAEEFGTDEGMIEQMLYHLEKLGFIEKNKTNCVPSCCSNCSSKKSCSNENMNISLWRITESGQQVLQSSMQS